MNVTELETAIADLSPHELMELATWFEEFVAQVWDRQIEEDVAAGRLDAVLAEVEQEYAAGRTKPL